MIKLYDTASGALIGQIGEQHLQFLMDQLEEEWSGDTDYYFNQDTIDMLQARGAPQELLSVLQQAIGERGEAEVRWSRV